MHRIQIPAAPAFTWFLMSVPSGSRGGCPLPLRRLLLAVTRSEFIYTFWHWIRTRASFRSLKDAYLARFLPTSHPFLVPPCSYASPLVSLWPLILSSRMVYAACCAPPLSPSPTYTLFLPTRIPSCRSLATYSVFPRGCDAPCAVLPLSLPLARPSRTLFFLLPFLWSHSSLFRLCSDHSCLGYFCENSV